MKNAKKEFLGNSLLADWQYKGEKRVIIGEKTTAKKGVEVWTLFQAVLGFKVVAKGGIIVVLLPLLTKENLLVVLGTMGQSKQGHSRRS